MLKVKDYVKLWKLSRKTGYSFFSYVKACKVAERIGELDVDNRF